MNNNDGSVTLQWGDGEYKFRLGVGELRELQDKCSAGPPAIFDRLVKNQWLVDDVLQPLRLGLIGGGLDATKALAKIGKYIGPGNFALHVVPAILVLQAAMFPAEDDLPGKAQAAAAAAMTTPDPMAKSDGQDSSAPPRPSDGQSTNSTAPAYGNSRPPLTAGTDATAAPTNGRAP